MLVHTIATVAEGDDPRGGKAGDMVVEDDGC